MGLYEKIFKVMEESEALSKEMTVGSGKNSYRAISEASVLNGIKPLLKKHKLILFPIEAEVKEHVDEYQNYNDKKTRLMTQVIAKYKLIDVESGEFEILATVGNGCDPQDKGSGKAWTYAYKALLQKTFMLFSGEDTENTHSDDVMPVNGSGDNKITTQELKDVIKSSGHSEQEYIDWYNDKFNKDIKSIQYMAQSSKQKIYNKLKGE